MLLVYNGFLNKEIVLFIIVMSTSAFRFTRNYKLKHYGLKHNVLNGVVYRLLNGERHVDLEATHLISIWAGYVCVCMRVWCVFCVNDSTELMGKLQC